MNCMGGRATAVSEGISTHSLDGGQFRLLCNGVRPSFRSIDTMIYESSSGRFAISSLTRNCIRVINK